MRPTRALTIKSSEKTSEFRFKDFQQASQYLYIHLSLSIPVNQLVPEVFEKFSYLSKNPAVEADENSETLFQFLEVKVGKVRSQLLYSIQMRINVNTKVYKSNN
ncbi:Hypothetical_protein [Hexamita inflata]|uniref:Hypothetical_protein n=1 Tax=Hexamita inflata TaxID=28002 RepID=A0AA86RV58_9EUKA|nr:Hypothetical protein HINF_LOCUS66277 [Hexamita inflata]